jgi:DNA modification methylase
MEIINRKIEELKLDRQIARFRWMGVHGMERQDTDKRIHPTQKPVELCGWFIEQFCKRDNIVVDIYGGSGSTLISCEKLNRKCMMMEIDPQYCQVIIDRWEKLTGNKAKKL